MRATLADDTTATAESVTEDVVRRALGRWVVEDGRSLISVDAVAQMCREEPAVEEVRWARQLVAQRRQVKALLGALERQVIETPLGPYTLVPNKYRAHTLLPGALTPADITDRYRLRAWRVSPYGAEIWVSTAKGRDEAKRLGLEELARRGVTPLRVDRVVVCPTPSDNWEAWVRGEGGSWCFWWGQMGRHDGHSEIGNEGVRSAVAGA